MVHLCTAPRSIQEIFLEGNKLYSEQEYEAALERYQSLAKKGPAVWYNLGNTWFRLGDYGRAIAAWGRAQRHAPKHLIKRAHHNRERAQQAAGIARRRGMAYVQEYLRYRLSFVSFLLLQYLLLLGWYFAFLFALLRLEYKNVILGLVMAFNVIMLGLICFKCWDDTVERAVVLRRELPVRVGPGTEYHSHDTVTNARTVTILAGEGDWYKVRCNNIVGWVPADAVDKI